MLYKLGQQPRCHLASKSWDHGTAPPKLWWLGTWSLSDRSIVKATAALRQVTHPCAWNFWTAMRTRLGSVLSVKQCLYMFYIGMIGMMCSPQIPWNHKLVQEGQHMWLGCSSPWEVNDSHKDTKLVHCEAAMLVGWFLSMLRNRKDGWMKKTRFCFVSSFGIWNGFWISGVLAIFWYTYWLILRSLLIFTGLARSNGNITTEPVPCMLLGHKFTLACGFEYIEASREWPKLSAIPTIWGSGFLAKPFFFTSMLAHWREIIFSVYMFFDA